VMRPVVTVDLEEWFHLLEYKALPPVEAWGGYQSRIEQNTHRLLGLLEDHQVHATVFCLGWLAERYPALLREIARAGHQIGCHSNVHTLVHQQEPQGFLEETRRALNAIADAVSAPVECYRAPGFSITEKCLWAFDILLRLGIRYDSSVFPGSHAHGGLRSSFPSVPCVLDLPSGVLREFPVSVAHVCGLQIPPLGGGYFRLLPYPFIRHFAAREGYAMAYFHPRDFDKDQPRLPGLPMKRRFKSYVGLGGANAKLGRFLQEFSGQSIMEAVLDVDWGVAPRVNLREPSKREQQDAQAGP
jgi:peptidoglycan-N-acetylglucosamine deacetylase